MMLMAPSLALSYGATIETRKFAPRYLLVSWEETKLKSRWRINKHCEVLKVGDIVHKRSILIWSWIIKASKDLERLHLITVNL